MKLRENWENGDVFYSISNQAVYWYVTNFVANPDKDNGDQARLILLNTASGFSQTVLCSEKEDNSYTIEAFVDKLNLIKIGTLKTIISAKTVQNIRERYGSNVKT